MESHQHCKEGLNHPLLKSTGSDHFPRMESREIVMETSSVTFVVDNYLSRLRECKMIESELFVAGGHSWRIVFDPHGNNEHVSLFLRLKKSDAREVVDFVCSFTVLDQTNSGLDYGLDERTVYRQFVTLQSRQMWGFPKFMKRAAIESRILGYLREDCIKIKADLGVFVVKKLPLPPAYDRFVFFKVGDKQFYAEESVLAKRCPSLLHHDHVIPEIERNVFEAMLWFIYKGKFHCQDRKAISDSRSYDPNSFASKMVAAADHFYLKSLKRQCQSIILYDNPKVLVLYDAVVSTFKKQWCIGCSLTSTKRKITF